MICNCVLPRFRWRFGASHEIVGNEEYIISENQVKYISMKFDRVTADPPTILEDRHRDSGPTYSSVPVAVSRQTSTTQYVPGSGWSIEKRRASSNAPRSFDTRQ